MMTRTVLLLHELPDGSSHHDWLLEVAPMAGIRVAPSRVLTFRLGLGPGPRGTALFHGERLPDHRDHYLTYQGPVSGDRGVVTRVAEGGCQLSTRRDGAGLRVVLRFGNDAPRAWIGVPEGPIDALEPEAGWRFELADGA